jgi:osmotically inducible lipoprotein OsmB
MKIRNLIAPALLGSALALGACAENYAVEGAVAGAAAGAGIAAVTGGEIDEGAAIGAAAGGIGGALIRKEGEWCYYRDRDGDEYRERC